jgi:hypothetical protein
MKKAKPKNAVLYVRDIPRDVKDHFHAWCVKRGMTLRDGTIKMMKDVVKGEARALRRSSKGAGR